MRRRGRQEWIGVDWVYAGILWYGPKSRSVAVDSIAIIRWHFLVYIWDTLALGGIKSHLGKSWYFREIVASAGLSWHWPG